MKRLLMALLLCLSISVPGGAQTFDPQALYGTWHIHLDGGPHKDGVIIFAERGPSRARWNDLPGDTFEKNPMGYSLFASPGAWIGVLLRDLDDDVRAYLLIFPRQHQEFIPAPSKPTHRRARPWRSTPER